jgi:hypothetical protein
MLHGIIRSRLRQAAESTNLQFSAAILPRLYFRRLPPSRLTTMPLNASTSALQYFVLSDLKPSETCQLNRVTTGFRMSCKDVRMSADYHVKIESRLIHPLNSLKHICHS